MARVNRRGTGRRKSQVSHLDDLNNDLRRDLERGAAIFEGFETREAMEETWELVRDDLMDAWIEKHPGTRPFAWWLLDHGQERPVTASWATADFVARHRGESRFGFLDTRAWSGGESLQQNETACLIERGLIPQDELERLPFAEDESKMEGWRRILYRTMSGPHRPRV